MTKRVLMIAFHFPPFSGSSGSQRSLAFSEYLPRYGWQPVVLTAKSTAYDATSESELARIPADLEVIRASAFDAARHFSVLGRYPGWLAVPDRWRSWQPFAIRAALDAVMRLRPAAIWSTYPIATAHAIAARVASKTRLPWIADMRDPMVEFDPIFGIAYPTDPHVRAARLAVERKVVDQGSRVVFCTAGAKQIHAARYGEVDTSRLSIIPNGYDEGVFRAAEAASRAAVRTTTRFRLVHSGTVYPGDDRGPGPLFRAIARLRRAGRLPAGFQLVLRATGYDAEVGRLAAESGLGDVVETARSLPYQEALSEMLGADGLLLLQGAASNPAIPAKLYEYLRAQRPILALVHPDGESAALLTRLNAGLQGRLDDEQSITIVLEEFLRRVADGSAPMASRAAAEQFSRESLTARLAALLDELVPAAMPT